MFASAFDRRTAAAALYARSNILLLLYNSFVWEPVKMLLTHCSSSKRIARDRWCGCEKIGEKNIIITSTRIIAVYNNSRGSNIHAPRCVNQTWIVSMLFPLNRAAGSRKLKREIAAFWFTRVRTYTRYILVI